MSRVKGSGYSRWKIQRITSLVLMIYIGFLLGVLLVNKSVDWNMWNLMVHNLAFQICSTIAILAMLKHSYLGIWMVVTDYAPRCVQNLINNILLFLIIILGVWGIYLVWSV